MLSASHKAENPEQVYYRSFLEMVRVGIRPNEFTLSTIITLFTGTTFSAILLAQLYGVVIWSGLN